MTQLRLINPLAAVPPTLFDLDPWDGYGPARRRLLEALAASPGQAGSFVLTGDAHTFAVGDLRVDFDDPARPIIATEFVTPAISSQFNADRIDLVRASIAKYNPHIRAFDPTINGYLRGTLTPGRAAHRRPGRRDRHPSRRADSHRQLVDRAGRGELTGRQRVRNSGLPDGLVPTFASPPSTARVSPVT